jgi:hypothetical protein
MKLGILIGVISLLIRLWIRGVDMWMRVWIRFSTGVREGQNPLTKALLRGVGITYTQVIHRRLWIKGGCG